MLQPLLFYFAFFICLSSSFKAETLDFKRLQVGQRCLLFSLPYDSSPDESNLSLDNEETLMNVHFNIVGDDGKENGKNDLVKYLQTFPFAAVLPVQPLQYLPTEHGVEVKFLRKKTKEKGSLDGGMVFMIREERDGYDIVCKRNSEGQTVSKIFSEKLVIMSLMQHITGEETTLAGSLPESISIESIFHRWL